MRFSLLVLAAASLVSASSLIGRQTGYPACALPCVEGPGVDFKGCGATDPSCQCNNKAFIASATACITKACTKQEEYQAALARSIAICSSLGVDLSGSGTGSTPQSTKAATPTQTPSSGRSNTVSGAAFGAVGVAAAILSL